VTYNRPSAQFSPDGTKRYILTRSWDTKPERGDSVAFAMLNPSDANALRDDQTIRKCVGFAVRWGFSGIMVVNLIPVVATDPWHLPPWSGIDPENDQYIRQALADCAAVILAWGSVPSALANTIAFPEHLFNFRALAGELPLFCIGRTLKGSPLHPSRAAYTSRMEEWCW
jgi:hypothetical protein